MKLGTASRCDTRISLLNCFSTSMRPPCPRRVAVTLVTVLSLAVSVATRYCPVVRDETHATNRVTPQSLDAKRQHLLNDGFHWFAPAATFGLRQPAWTAVALLPAVAPHIRLYPEDGLRNRPPPSC